MEVYSETPAIEIKRRIHMKVHKPKELYFYIYICEVPYVNMISLSFFDSLRLFPSLHYQLRSQQIWGF